MKFLNKTLAAAAGAAALLAGLGAATSAAALCNNGDICITIDENGNGTLNGFLGPQALPSGMQADPGPGGLSSVLTYDLENPPGLISGDVALLEPSLPGLPVSDLLRFNAGEVGPGGGLGSLVVYSNPEGGGLDSLADTTVPPSATYPNLLFIREQPLGGGRDGAIYIPTLGQPGFVLGADAPVEYIFLSNGAAIPEPATWALMILGVGAAGAALRGKRKAALA